MPENNEQIELLREILKWIKIAGIKEVKSLIEIQLTNDSKKLIYIFSDGTRGTEEIAKNAGGISPQTVANYWKEWAKVGLGELVSVKGGKRFRRSFVLEDFGIKFSVTVPKPESILETEEEKINDGEKSHDAQ